MGKTGTKLTGGFMTEKKILIVDDEENIRKLLEEVVGSLGYEIFLANNGQEAFRIASTENIDLILLDIMMPTWNGVDAIKSLDFIEKKPKFLVVSGYISDDLRQELKLLDQVEGYVQKPFKLDEIRKRIQDILT
jgi:DNA-binding response OmpR family regulator